MRVANRDISHTQPMVNHVATVPTARRPRKVYDASFKLHVVEQALKLPPSNRIKPTCRQFPGIEPVRACVSNRAHVWETARPDARPSHYIPPCRSHRVQVQVRKWIRNLAALQQAQPTAKLVQSRARTLPSPPDFATDESSETESIQSTPQQPAASRRAKPPQAPADRTPLAAQRVCSPYSQYSGHYQQVPPAASEEVDMQAAHELLSLGGLFGGGAAMLGAPAS